MSAWDVEPASANKELVRRHFEEIFNNRRFDVADELIADVFVETGLHHLKTARPA